MAAVASGALWVRLDDRGRDQLRSAVRSRLRLRRLARLDGAARARHAVPAAPARRRAASTLASAARASTRVRRMTPSKDISRLIEIMAALRDPADRLPVGSAADVRDHRALHHRGGLRGGRRDRARRPRRPEGRAGRSAAAGRLSRAHGRGAGRVRVRRRRRGHHGQDDPPPSARVRHARTSAQPASRRASGIAPRPRRRRPRRSAARAAGVLDDVPVGAARSDARHQVAEQSRQGRLRLAVARAGVRQARRRSSPSSRRRSPTTARTAADRAGHRGGVRRSAVRRRQRRAPPEARPRERRCAQPTRSSSAASATSSSAWPSRALAGAIDLAEMDALWDEARPKAVERSG